MAKKKRRKRRRGRAKAAPRSRAGRLLAWAAIALALAVAGLVLGRGLIVRGVAAAELEKIWPGPASVGWVTGHSSRDVTLRNVRLRRRDRRLMIGLDEVVVHLERPASSGDPGRVLGVEIEGGRVFLEIEDFEASHEPGASHESRPAPDDAPEEPPPDLPDEIRVRGLAVHLNLAPRGRRPVVVPFEDLDARISGHGDGTLDLHRLEGRVRGGRVTGFAKVGFPDPATRWQAELNLVDVDLARLVRGTPLAGSMTSGRLAAYAKLSGDPAGGVEGAGFVTSERSHLWDLPVFAGVLDALGVLAGRGDYLRRARARFRVDRGHFYFHELMAVGSPVSLYGHGSMRLDGTELDADFVPRLGEGLTEGITPVGTAAQVLLDIAKGAVIEVQLRGRLDEPEVTALPLPVVTRPVQEFFRWVEGR